MQVETKKAARITVSALLPWQIALTFFGFLVIGLNSGAMGVLLPELGQYYQLNKAEISYLFWFGALGYLLAGISSGFMVERLGLARFLLCGVIIFGLASFALSLKPVLIVALIARLGLGLGAAIVETGSNFFVGKLPRNTTLFNYLHAFFGAGALVGPLLAAFILSLPLQWNNLFFLWIGFSFLLLIGFGLFFLKDYPLPPSRSQNSGTKPVESNLMVQALRLPLVWLSAFFLLIYVGVEMTVGLWSYTFLTDIQRLPGVTAGWLVSGYWLGLTVGRLILAKLAEKFGLSSRNLMLAAIIGTVLAIALLWLVPATPMVAFSLWLAGFCLAPIYPTTLAVISKLLPSRLLPSSIAFVSSISILGVAVFPAIAGNLAELFGLNTLLPYILILSVAMLIFWPFVFKKGEAKQIFTQG